MSNKEMPQIGMEQVVENAVAYIEVLFESNCGGHDAGHTMRVYRNALMIAENEPGCDDYVVALAALLHDADDYKLFKTKNNEHARAFLQDNLVLQEDIDRICEVINAVSFSRNRDRSPETTEGRIVQDADRLDAIGAVGIARAFAYGGEHGRSLQDSIQHFHEKLLLLKDMMNTETGKRMAEQRHRYLLDFLEEYHREADAK